MKPNRIAISDKVYDLLSEMSHWYTFHDKRRITLNDMAEIAIHDRYGAYLQQRGAEEEKE
jgi:class 3 adenylate cyclase